MNRLLSFLISFIFLAVVGLFALADGATAAQFYLSPASGSVQQNNNITLDVRVSTQGVQTAVADLELNYDQSKFEFQNYSNTGSPLITALGLSGGGGIVQVTQFIPGSGDNPPTPTQGDFLYGKVTFKALVTGSTTLSFSVGPGNSVVYDFSTGDEVTTTGQNGTYTLTAIPNPPPPPVSPNPPPSDGTGTQPPPAPEGSTSTNSEGAETVTIPNSFGDTTAPKITNIKITDITDSSIVVEWNTDEAATSYVDYGLDSNYGSGNGDASYTKDHKVTISSGLKPSTKYNFRVFSSDQAGNTAYSKNQTFTTKPPVSVQRTYRFVGLAMIIGGLGALGVLAFFYFRKKGPHPDNLTPSGPSANLNPPI